MVTSLAITPCLVTLARGITNAAELGSTAQAQPVPTVLRDVLNIAKMTTSPILVRHLLIVTAFTATDIVPVLVMSLAPVAGKTRVVARVAAPAEVELPTEQLLMIAAHVPPHIPAHQILPQDKPDTNVDTTHTFTVITDPSTITNMSVQVGAVQIGHMVMHTFHNVTNKNFPNSSRIGEVLFLNVKNV